MPLPPVQLALLPFLSAVKETVPPVEMVVDAAEGAVNVTAGCAIAASETKEAVSKKINLTEAMLLKVKSFMFSSFSKQLIIRLKRKWTYWFLLGIETEKISKDAGYGGDWLE